MSLPKNALHSHQSVGPLSVTAFFLEYFSVNQFLVTRSMEDFVTWVDGSKIKRAIKTYEDKVDDFDLLGEG